MSIKTKISDVVIDRICDENVFNIIGLNFLQPLVISMGIELELDPAYWNTNGWQGDWWWQFDYLGEPFILSGGLFTNFITIALDVDKLNDEDETNDVKLSFGGEYV